MMQKGCYLEGAWVLREVLTQPSRLQGCCNLFVPTAKRCQARETRLLAIKSKAQEAQRTMPRTPLGTRVTERGRHLALAIPALWLCRMMSLLLTQREGAVPLERGRGRSTFHMATTAAAAVGAAVSLFLFPIC